LQLALLWWVEPTLQKHEKNSFQTLSKAFSRKKGNNGSTIITRNASGAKPATAFQDYRQEEVADIQQGLEPLTNSQRSKAQVALRYALSHPVVATIIPGASRETQLEENVGSSQVTLTENELEYLQKISKANVYEAHR
jgi:aryl-alcohol dehydrogenase-like predicted oxidoreductase